MQRGSLLEKIADAHLALACSEEAYASIRAAAELFRETGASDDEARCRVRAAISAYVLALPEPTSPLYEMLARVDRSDFWLAVAYALDWRGLLLRYGFRAGRSIILPRSIHAPYLPRRTCAFAFTIFRLGSR